jgi:ribosomal protein S18 acetylase RimI-like enzyme
MTKTAIANTTAEDLPRVMDLFGQAMTARKNEAYKVWREIDPAGILGDIKQGLQYKITMGQHTIGVFSVQHSDPLIWRHHEAGNAIYLHRIVIDRAYGGQRLLGRVIDWALVHCLKNSLNYVRMDTWADNAKLIGYYRSFGFEFVENYRTPDTASLPIQNRDLEVALLQLSVNGSIRPSDS